MWDFLGCKERSASKETRAYKGHQGSPASAGNQALRATLEREALTVHLAPPAQRDFPVTWDLQGKTVLKAQREN